MNFEPTIYVSKQQLDKLWDITACMHISEEKPVKTWFHRNIEYVVTGGGKDWLTANRVVDLARYTGDRRPMTYHHHNAESDAGRRERGYEGMLIRCGGRHLVMLEMVNIKANHEATQLGLF